MMMQLSPRHCGSVKNFFPGPSGIGLDVDRLHRIALEMLMESQLAQRNARSLD